MFMRTNDTRKESQKGQDGIRRKVIHAVFEGMKQVDAARVFGVSRTSIWTWMKAYETQGEEGLGSKKRGRKTSKALSAQQAASIRKSVLGKTPGQLRLPGFLWTRESVGLLIYRRFGMDLSRWTVGRYLKDWGLSVQKPAKRALEQNPAQVRYWLQTKYPALVRQAAAEEAGIFWGDEMGLRSEHQTGTTWGAKGQTPVVRTSGNRFRCNMLSAITNRGRMAFMVFTGKFISGVFITFLKRLIRHCSGRKVFLIVDRHPVHRSGKVSKWLAAHSEDIALFFLPAYSPELNPDELLNNAAKAGVSNKVRAKDQKELQAALRSYLRSTQRRPEQVKSFFKGKHVLYARAA
jgi:transposase